MGDGAFSPYRVYMHNVLSQRCGTQVGAHGVYAHVDSASIGTTPARVRAVACLPCLRLRRCCASACAAARGLPAAVVGPHSPHR